MDLGGQATGGGLAKLLFMYSPPTVAEPRIDIQSCSDHMTLQRVLAILRSRVFSNLNCCLMNWKRCLISEWM
jgi:hypothetical protein